MPVNERFEDPGSFNVRLDPELAPLDTILNQLKVMGHIVVTSQWHPHPAQYTEANLLAAARYSGVVLETEWGTDNISVRGAGNVWHLGDSYGNGPILSKTVDATGGVTIDNLFAALGTTNGILPPGITAGTITTTGAGSYTGTFYPSATALECVRTITAALNLHWRINPNWSIDVCLASRDEVFTVSTPKVVAVRRGFGSDPTYTGIEPTGLRTRENAWRWVSRSVIEAVSYSGVRSIAGFKDLSSNPYFDPQGNPLVRNVIQSGPNNSETSFSTFHDRTLADWTAFDEQEINTLQYELSGAFQVGDFINVYDPPSGFMDTTNPIWFRGQLIWPQKIRVLEDEWPLVEGMGVYYRPGGAAITTANWIDLTRYVRWDQ